jgi:exopolyphosphatase / guanosine-5'-triphosphate,3'-diphosphate pyrophosphatase
MTTPADERRLVVDIGGGSSEVIVGQGFAAKTLQSYRLGSASWSQQFFADGQLSPQNFHAARCAALDILGETAAIFGQFSDAAKARLRWDIAYGASGTVGAVAELLNAQNFDAPRVAVLKTRLANVGDGIITRDGLLALQAKLLAFQTVERIHFDGLKDDRQRVIAGGVVILLAVFERLNIDFMVAAQGALRHGVLHGLIDKHNR